jgi:hypothetical protein
MDASTWCFPRLWYSALFLHQGEQQDEQQEQQHEG